MKKLLSILIICFAITVTAQEIPIPDSCEYIDNTLMCLVENFEFGINLEFTDDIYCYSENLTTNPDEMGVCFSTVKFTKGKSFQVTYQREPTIQEQLELENVKLVQEDIERIYFKNEEVDVVVHPDIIDFNKCQHIEGEDGIYENICPFKGKSYNTDILMLTGKEIMIMSIITSNYFTLFLDNIIYIILLIVIAVVVYSIVKKPKPKKKKRRRKK